MKHDHPPAVPRPLTRLPSRREVLHGLTGAGLALGLARLPIAAAAKKRRPNRRKGLCQADGSPCKRAGRSCQKRFCLNAPFTIEATWTATQTADHAAFLFVPAEDATTAPAPYVNEGCNPNTSTCEEAYPFACVSQDARGPGDEITTIHQLLPGRYEYWIGLDLASPAGEVAVVLRDATGRVVRQWASPANPATGSALSWHVFDVDGRHGRVASIDEPIAGGPPQQVNAPSTDVCPR